MSLPPTNIRAHQYDQILELTWPEGKIERLPYRIIRTECPCAVCKNEWTGERMLDPATIRQDIQLEEMEPVGSYAVRFSWNDGHSSGIFTWESLANLGTLGTLNPETGA